MTPSNTLTPGEYGILEEYPNELIDEFFKYLTGADVSELLEDPFLGNRCFNVTYAGLTYSDSQYIANASLYLDKGVVMVGQASFRHFMKESKEKFTPQKLYITIPDILRNAGLVSKFEISTCFSAMDQSEWSKVLGMTNITQLEIKDFSAPELPAKLRKLVLCKSCLGEFNVVPTTLHTLQISEPCSHYLACIPPCITQLHITLESLAFHDFTFLDNLSKAHFEIKDCFSFKNFKLPASLKCLEFSNTFFEDFYDFPKISLTSLSVTDSRLLYQTENSHRTEWSVFQFHPTLKSIVMNCVEFADLTYTSVDAEIVKIRNWPPLLRSLTLFESCIQFNESYELPQFLEYFDFAPMEYETANVSHEDDYELQETHSKEQSLGVLLPPNLHTLIVNSLDDVRGAATLTNLRTCRTYSDYNVIRLPKCIEKLHVSGSEFDYSGLNLKHLTVDDFDPEWSDILLPHETLVDLRLHFKYLSQLGTHFPSNLQTLELTNCILKNQTEKLLVLLSLNSLKIISSSLDPLFACPPNLVNLELTHCSLSSMEGVRLPDSLRYLNITLLGIPNLDMSSLPVGLHSIKARLNAICNVVGSLEQFLHLKSFKLNEDPFPK